MADRPMELSPSTRKAEIDRKHKKVTEYLQSTGLDGLVLTKYSNFSWATAGGDNRIEYSTEVGTSSVLFTQEQRFLLTNNVESPRVRVEEIADLGFSLVDRKWYTPEMLAEMVKKLMPGRKVASDTGVPGTSMLKSDFNRLRYVLEDSEVERYRWLGKVAASAVESVVAEVERGMTEYEVAGEVSRKLGVLGVFPVVLLVGADERVVNFRHPIPTARTIRDYVMVVLVGVKWGLNVALTRSAYIGRLPEELAKKQLAVTKVDATYIANSLPGKKFSDVLRAGAEAYAAEGYPGEWELHFQGGLIGYNCREFDATPATHDEVLDGEAVAWNPTIAGVKSEDTFLVKGMSHENLTYTGVWPMISQNVGGVRLERPAILELHG